MAMFWLSTVLGALGFAAIMLAIPRGDAQLLGKFPESNPRDRHPRLLSARSATRLAAGWPATSSLWVKQLSVPLRAFPRGVTQDLRETNQEGRCEGRGDQCAPEDLG